MIFLYPAVFNSIIECNLMISKFSPQAGALRSPAIYNFNDNDIFVQMKKGESLGKLVNLTVKQESKQPAIKGGGAKE